MLQTRVVYNSILKGITTLIDEADAIATVVYNSILKGITTSHVFIIEARQVVYNSILKGITNKLQKYDNDIIVVYSSTPKGIRTYKQLFFEIFKIQRELQPFVQPQQIL